MNIDVPENESTTLASNDEKAAKRHLRGWLSYAFARCVATLFFMRSVLMCLQVYSEVFVVVSVTMFLPICLEQFARDNGVLLPDKTAPCMGADTTPATGNAEETRCVVRLGWMWIDSASFRWAFM